MLKFMAGISATIFHSITMTAAAVSPPPLQMPCSSKMGWFLGKSTKSPQTITAAPFLTIISIGIVAFLEQPKSYVFGLLPKVPIVAIL